MSEFITSWDSPVDPGGGSPGRTYYSPPIIGDWTRLWATFTVTGGWSGSFGITGETAGAWFNRFPQPASPFTEYDPHGYTTQFGDQLYVTTNNGSAGLQVHVDLYGDAPGTFDNAVCQYGTRTKSQFRGLSIGAATLITLVTEYYGIRYLGTLFDGLVGIGLATDVLCQGPPPLLPNISAADFIPGPNGEPPAATFETVLQVYEALLWPQVCECIPGSPTPTPPNVPTFTLPPNVPTDITLPLCEEGSVCDLLTRIFHQIGQLQQRVAQMSDLVTLVQRQHVPFAYVPGTLHSGLSGAGTIAVQGILGIAVQSTVIPPWLSASMAPVNSYYRLGEISFGTADGWIRRQVVTHNPHLLLDIGGDITEIAYAFTPGVTANIQEFRREP